MSLLFAIEVDDKGTPKIKEFRGELEKAERHGATFTDSVKNATLGLGSLGGQIVMTGGKMALMAGTAVLGAATAGFFTLKSALSSCIEAAETQEAAIAKLESVLRATGGATKLTSDELQAYASELQKSTKFGDEAILNSMAILASFKEVSGDVFKGAMQAGLDMSTIMGTDLQSSMVQLGKALNDPILGVSALTRVGVTFNEEQKKMIKTLVESGDMMGAQAIILKELQSEFGGAAQAAAGTFGGALQQLKNSFGDMLESIGFGITKNQAFVDIINKVKTGIEALTVKISAWISANGELIGSKVTEWFDFLVEKIGDTNTIVDKMVKLWRETLVPAFLATKDTLGEIKTAFEWVGDIIGHVAAVVVDFIEEVDKIVHFEKQFREILTPAFLALKDTIGSVLSGIMSFFDAIGTSIGWLAAKIVELWEKYDRFIEHIRNMPVIRNVIEFMGKGSATLPISEKLSMLYDDFDAYVKYVNGLHPKLTLDTSPTTNAIKNTLNEVQSLADAVQNMTRESAGVALKIFKPKDWETALKVASEDLGWIEDSKLYFGSVGGYESSVRSLHQRLNQWAKEFGVSEYEIPGFAGTYRTYQSGTGSSGLPYTGLFMGHEGEIVLNKKESDDMRRGNSSHVTNINISPTFMTGDSNSARLVAREVQAILNEQSNRWG